MRPRKKLTQLMAGMMIGAGFTPGCSPEHFTDERAQMVSAQIEAEGVRDARVLAAMRKIPRHLFVPRELASNAYGDHPLPIGHGQTISQPFIVAFMTEAAQLTPQSKVLEIGTGSGYQAAVLGELAGQVYTIEIVEPLAKQSAKLLKELGYKNIFVRHGDGYKGWPDQAPFDAIIVTAAPEEIPPALIEQLKVGGRMLIPVGSLEQGQGLFRITKTEQGIKKEQFYPVRFVPMVKENPAGS
jgi:protein-L-isoaspartate(D-aspartate) O-methyltransferase